MSEITGNGVTDVLAAGASDDGRHLWVRYRLVDGAEQTLIYPAALAARLTEAVAKAAALADAARTSQSDGGTANPRSQAIRLREIHATASPAHAGPILEIVTESGVVLACEAPWPQLKGFLTELVGAVAALRQDEG